jgi:hypothetical protein
MNRKKREADDSGRAAKNNKKTAVLQLPPHAGSSLADFSTLKMEAIRSSATSVQSTISTRRHTPEDGILHSHRRENLKSYIWSYFIFKINGGPNMMCVLG